MRSPATEVVLHEVRSALVAILPTEDLAQVDLDELREDTLLLSLPIDSVLLMSIMNELEEHFTVFITEEAAFEFSTIGDIARYIQTKTADKMRRLNT